MKNRIWELDAFRGLCILGMVVVHFIYDLVELYGIVQWEYPPAFSFVKSWGGVLFLLLSGVCVTLGSRSLRRGVMVLLGGLVCSVVTLGMYLLEIASHGIIIYFGVLHCLGCCMLLWPVFKKLPARVLATVGIVFAAVGLWLKTQIFSFPWLMPLGFAYTGFVSSDYFPLLPNLGYFLLGAALGRTLYCRKESLLPRVDTNALPIRFLLACGRHSLWIYLLHQPLLSGLCMLLSLL